MTPTTSRALAALALLLLLGQASAAELVRAITPRDLGVDTHIEEWSGKRLSLADVDLDGRLDILAHNDNARIYAIDVASGRALVENRTRHPYGPDLGPLNGVTAADLDNDGRVEIVAANRAAVVTVWTVEPREGGGVNARFLWDRHLKDHFWRPTADAAAILGDLDADGDLEMVVQTEENGTFALHHDGSVLWSVAEWGGNAEAVIHDVDADGDLDVVIFTDGGMVYALEGATGKRLWRFRSADHGVWPASIVSAGHVADIDGDGRVEVVFCTRNVENATPNYAPGAPYYAQHHFVLFAIRDGKLLWKVKPSWGNPMCSAYLASHDVDGDGKREIFGMDWNTIGHKPGGWERLGPAHAFSFTSDGKERWHVSLDTWDAKPPFAMADIDGDGDQDVIAYDSSSIVGLDAGTGRTTAYFRSGGGVVQQGPIVADIDGKGNWRLIVAVTGHSQDLLVYSLPRQASPPAWPGWEFPARPARLAEPVTPTPTPTTPTPTEPIPSSTTPPASSPVSTVDPATPPSITPEAKVTPAWEFGLVVAVTAVLALLRPRRSNGAGAFQRR